MWLDATRERLTVSWAAVVVVVVMVGIVKVIVDGSGVLVVLGVLNTILVCIFVTVCVADLVFTRLTDLEVNSVVQ
jgi:hypothetical protein